MKLLMIGDVVSESGCKTVRRMLPDLKKRYQVDVVIANGENSAKGNGVTPESAEHLFKSGVDIITLGNHAFRRKQIFPYLEETQNIIRPSNFPKGSPGKGFCVYDMGYVNLAVINLCGQVYMEPNNSPFEDVDRLLQNIDTKTIIVDFHAEATGEKGALAHYLSGRVSAVIGTHTHVQTADEQILNGNTGFISDVGMVGPINSILGVDPSKIVRKTVTHLPTKFEVKEGKCLFNAVFLKIDSSTGNCVSIERIKIV